MFNSKLWKQFKKPKEEIERKNYYKQRKKEYEEWEKIHNENMKALEEYAEHFDGYGNVKCEHCENWIDTEFMGKQCPICNAKIPRYEFKMKG